MSIKFTIANICEKFNSSDNKNINYQPILNCFDVCIKNVSNINLISPNISLQHNLSLYNSIMSISNKQLYESHGCFVQSSRPNNLKKEDLYLINMRTDKCHKIFFDKYAMMSWGNPNNSYVIKYGIPDCFEYKKIKRNKKVALFNISSRSDQNINEVISKILTDNQIDYITITNLDNIVDKLNMCDLAIEMYEHNVYNALCAKACGCNCLMPQSPYLEKYSEDIVLFEDIQQMISICKNSTFESESDILHRYDFHTFQNSLKEIIEIINNEVFVL